MDTRGDIQNQSRGQPGRQSNYFLVRPELAGSHRSGRLRLGQTEQELPAVGSLNTPPNSRPADCQTTQDESGLAAGTIETPPRQQVAGQTGNIVGQGVGQLLAECGEGLSGRMPVIGEADNQERLVNERETVMTKPSDGRVGQQGDGRVGQQEVQIVEPSPTTYSEDNMPRSVEASRFKMVVVKAQSLRTQILKSFRNLGEYIEEIKELEPVETNNVEESDYFLNIWADAEKEFKKVIEIKSAHEDLVNKVRLMCGYMLEGYVEGTVATKVQGDAKEALNKIEKAEEGLDNDIKQFRLANRTYLMGRKRKQTPQVTERQTGAPVGISSQWILQMANKMEPEGTLKNDARLTEMKAWKK